MYTPKGFKIPAMLREFGRVVSLYQVRRRWERGRRCRCQEVAPPALQLCGLALPGGDMA